MAISFLPVSETLTTTKQELHRCTADTEEVIFSTVITNIDAASDYDFNLDIVRTSTDPDETWPQAVSVPVPANSAMDWPKFTLNAGDYIQASASADNVVQITFSVLKLT